MADDAGALLVRSGLVPPTALDAARIAVASHGGTIGEQLVASGVIGDDALTDFYRSRLLVPQVNPNTLARLPRRVINAIPGDMAVELRAIPVSLDDENTLTVAMSDPSDSHAVDEIAFFTGTYVVRAVATQMQIAWCLAHYYGHVTPLGERLLQPTGGQPDTAPGAFPRASTPPPGVPELAAAAAVPRVKGDTTRINAARHRAIAPVTGPVEVPRPWSGELDLPRATPPPAPVVEEVAAPEPTPRSRSISGEIRVPTRRAASIRPPMPEPLADADDESGPVITMEAGSPDEDPTGPRMVPVRRTKQQPNPPELAERAGEVRVSSAPDRAVSQDEPRIIIEEEPSTGVVVREGQAPDSEPVLLQRRRESDAPTGQHPAIQAAISAAVEEAADEVSGEVLVLDRPIARAASTPREVPRSARPEKRTVVGIGALPAVTRHVRDTDAGGIPGIYDDAPTAAEHDATRVDGIAAPPGDEITDETLAAPPAPASDDTGPIAPPAPARPSSQPIVSGSITARRPSTDGSSTTAVMSAVELDEAIPDRASEVVPGHLDDVDDGWGPPGTTIPPPLLGAIPGIDGRDSGLIPVPDVESAPLIVAPPAPPEAVGGEPARLARALEEATSRSLALLQTLERATSRDEVIQLMMRHLAATHRRAGFFSIKNGELGVFAMLPPPEILSVTSLRLDRPSTLQDVVGTRLPYRGPMHDDASRNFLAAALGACPPEILLVPVVVRERVVGVLFGEHRLQHAFDDQLALAARAAGLALERILKSKRA